MTCKCPSEITLTNAFTFYCVVLIEKMKGTNLINGSKE